MNNNINSNPDRYSSIRQTEILLEQAQMTYLTITHYNIDGRDFAYIVVDAKDHIIEYRFAMFCNELDDIEVRDIPFMVAMNTFALDIYYHQPAGCMMSLHRNN